MSVIISVVMCSISPSKTLPSSSIGPELGSLDENIVGQGLARTKKSRILRAQKSISKDVPSLLGKRCRLRLAMMYSLIHGYADRQA